MTDQLNPIKRRDPVTQIIGRIRYAGMQLAAHNGRLYITKHPERLTDRHRVEIDRHRTEIVRTLESLPQGCVVPHVCREIGRCSSDRCAQDPACTKREVEHPHG